MPGGQASSQQQRQPQQSSGSSNGSAGSTAAPPATAASDSGSDRALAQQSGGQSSGSRSLAAVGEFKVDAARALLEAEIKDAFLGTAGAAAGAIRSRMLWPTAACALRDPSSTRMCLPTGTVQAALHILHPHRHTQYTVCCCSHHRCPRHTLLLSPPPHPTTTQTYPKQVPRALVCWPPALWATPWKTSWPSGTQTPLLWFFAPHPTADAPAAAATET